MTLLARLSGAALLLLAQGAAAYSQGASNTPYPNRFVRMVLGYAAGGGTDVASDAASATISSGSPSA